MPNDAEYAKKWYIENRERILARQKERRAGGELEYRKEYQAKYYRDLRNEVLEHYGGACECCGENTREFLAIDHIAKTRAEGKVMHGYNLVAWLRRNNYPEDYRVLCHNCNQSYGQHGICPHVLEEHDA